MQVLIVDDEVDILTTIADQLSLDNIIADCAYNGEQALALVQKNNYDVIVLDVMMPKLNGIATCQKIRAHGCTTPIIFLTARDTLDDKIIGFNAGGDDYLVKPFAMDELLCRIQALSKRVSRQSISQVQYGELLIDLDSKQIYRSAQLLNLNQIQYKLLKQLITQAPKIVTREQLEYDIWQGEPPDSDSFRSHLYQLRQIVDKPYPYDILKTVRNQGYKLMLAREINE
jgi:DNA-binding response OmpR family regulator